MRAKSVSAFAAATMMLACLSLVTGCKESDATPPDDNKAATQPGTGNPATRSSQGDNGEVPCPTGDKVATKGTDGKDLLPCPTGTDPGKGLPRYAADSPFKKGTNANPSVAKAPKRLWANSFLFAEAPELEVEKWLTETPETKGKYVLLEFWATWCGPCRRSIPLLNKFHEKYKDELVVIGISDETEADVRNPKVEMPPIEYYSAIDTQARTKKAVGVWGIPHVVIIEPGGAVIWQGFPLLKDYELTEEIIEKILAIGRRLKKQGLQ